MISKSNSSHYLIWIKTNSPKHFKKKQFSQVKLFKVYRWRVTTDSLTCSFICNSNKYVLVFIWNEKLQNFIQHFCATTEETTIQAMTVDEFPLRQYFLSFFMGNLSHVSFWNTFTWQYFRTLAYYNLTESYFERSYFCTQLIMSLLRSLKLLL